MDILRLRPLVLISFGVLLALSLAMVAVVYRGFADARLQVVELERVYQVSLGLVRLEHAVISMQAASRGYLLGSRPEELAEFERASAAAEPVIAGLRERVVDPEQRTRLAGVGEAIDRYRESLQQRHRLIAAGRRDEALRNFTTDIANVERIHAIQTAAERLSERERRLVDRVRAVGQASFDRLRSQLAAGAFAIIAVALAAATLIIGRMQRRLGQSTVQMVGATTQIAATLEEHERIATHQAAAVSQTSATMDEFGASIRQVAEQAEALAAAARQTLNVTRDGGAAVTATQTGVEQMKERVDAIAAQILSLSELAGQIGKIADLVSELAGETNMLALNAAVEAARAGESGRGFAVVASEVRKLAEQSRASAGHANALVEQIQRATNAAVLVTEEGGRTAGEVLRLVRSAGDAFVSIETATTRVVEGAQQVNLNGRQQANAVSQVVEAMGSLTAGARQTAEGIAQTRSGIEQINEAAHRVRAVV